MRIFSTVSYHCYHTCDMIIACMHKFAQQYKIYLIHAAKFLKEAKISKKWFKGYKNEFTENFLKSYYQLDRIYSKIII